MTTTIDFDEHERAQWAGQATAFRDSYAALCAHPAAALLDAVAVSTDAVAVSTGAGAVGPGIRLLDAGTGTGAVAELAVSRGATVVAVDAEPSMLELARVRVPAATFHQAILPVLPFAAATFDAAVANFVVNHVGDPVAAVRELRRVVRPGGRVAVTVWPWPPPPAQRLWTTIFDAAGADRSVDLPRVAPEKDFARTADGLADLLGRAGLTGVHSDTLTWTLHIDPEAWWHGPASGLGTSGTVLRRQDAATAARIRDQYERHTAAYRAADGRLALPTAALLASGSVA